MLYNQEELVKTEHMEDHEIAALATLLICKSVKEKDVKSRKKRQYKVRPLNRLRWKCGFYKVYFARMKLIDAQQFFKYTRMERETFDDLLQLIDPIIRKKKTMNQAISSEERLAILLHFLSQGTSMQTVAWKYQVGKSTVHCIIKETSQAICDVLEPIYLKTPRSEVEWQSISNDFSNKWNFPHCLGALDGKHIKMRAPKKSGSQYYNYLKYFSIVLLASCDANYKFTVVDIGGYGSLSDGATLKESRFGENLQLNTFKFPPRTPIEGCSENIAFPYYFVADAAFPLSEHIITPYPGALLSPERENFNKRLSRARRLIENSFGILAARWRILYNTFHADVDLVELCIKTCVCLHNLLCKPASLYCPPGFVDNENEENGQWRAKLTTPLESINIQRHNSKHSFYSLRDHLARHLNAEGKLSN